MKITILTDNTPCIAMPQLIAEHGLSILVTHKGKQILCDMGLGTAFMTNAKALHIDLARVDMAFVSHGHKDHSGGLMNFLLINPFASVYLSLNVFHQHFFTSRHSEKRDISTANEIWEQYAHRMTFVEDSHWLTSDIAIVRCPTHQYPCPVGNRYLTAQREGENERADDFSHELSLAFRTERGLVIISSCSHNGALNIIDACSSFTKENKIYAFVGGLHFVAGDHTLQEVANFQKDWNRLMPDTLLFTGHCTSDKAKKELSAVIPHLHIFHTGEDFTL